MLKLIVLAVRLINFGVVSFASFSFSAAVDKRNSFQWFKINLKQLSTGLPDSDQDKIPCIFIFS